MKTTYNFTKQYEMRVISGTVPKEELISKLIEDVLKKGYIPAKVRYEKGLCYSGHFQIIDMVGCLGAYAGKVKARKIFSENKEILLK